MAEVDNQTLIVADPSVSKTAMMADINLPLKPRSDLRCSTGSRIV